MIELRDYQRDAITAVARARNSGLYRAMIVQPTGTGKTVVFSEIIRSWCVPTLVLAHREELLTQAKAKLLHTWPEADVGIVGSGYEEWEHLVTVGSVQSLSRPKRLQRLISQSVQLAIVDEAHHAAAKSYQSVLGAVRAGEPGGAFLLGVTATPGRQDKQPLDAIFGKPVYSVSLRDMIDQQFLCDLRGIQIKTRIRLDGVHTRHGDFAEGELAQAVNITERNDVIVQAYQQFANGRQGIAFSAGVSHAHALADAFNDAGISAAALDGTTPRDERHEMLHKYADGSLRIICNCGVLTEGFDAPETSCIILARPTQSQGLYIQMVGRGTRPAPDKTDCIVLDIADVCSKHDLVMLPTVLGLPPYSENNKEFSAHDAFTRPETYQGPVDIIGRDFHLVLGTNRTWTPEDGNVYILDLPGHGERIYILSQDQYSWGVFYDPPHAPGLSVESQDLVPVGSCPTYAIARAWAERKARIILDGKRFSVDRSERWRSAPASDKQLDALTRFRVPVHDGMTKGEASDWMDWKIFLLDLRKNRASA